MTRRLKITPKRQKITQQGSLSDDVEIDDLGLSKYVLRNPDKATQTDMFNEPTDYSRASSNRSTSTAIEGTEDRKQERQVSASTGESVDRFR